MAKIKHLGGTTELYDCQTGKTGYRSKAEAMRIVEIMRKKKHRNGLKQHARTYFCEYCGSWHITSQKQGKARP